MEDDKKEELKTVKPSKAQVQLYRKTRDEANSVMAQILGTLRYFCEMVKTMQIEMIAGELGVDTEEYVFDRDKLVFVEKPKPQGPKVQEEPPPKPEDEKPKPS